ncbi:DNA-BINDING TRANSCRIPTION FACTOR 2, SAWADEE homeodomain homolog 2 [Hibiscus trionum]|uniref:DNA-BINDING TRANSCRIPTION FACTOR 2, SAWADEE homeodomain homolog 2 n=1 Tax=Hibiscus trionum TaxID=183268 RepID=A0A9W7IYI4_HIBTR|nr:DNA-BINDING TRANSCRIPTION FACTOR 2, SAWADEE homeodomain homolog 2 [Hibiscus trionum]
MSQPPTNGGPAFRFTQTEVGEMETILQEHHNQMPVREILLETASKFLWSQNRRYAIRAKSSKVPILGKLNITYMHRDDSNPMRNVLQPVVAPMLPHMTTPLSASTCRCFPI